MIVAYWMALRRYHSINYKGYKMKKKANNAPFYACVVKSWNAGQFLRSSFYSDLSKAIAYAEDHFGVVRIEEVGGQVVWQRGEVTA